MSARSDILDRYMDGFRRSDHAEVLACLTDDVVWHVHGVRTTRGKDEFDSEIENPAFEGSPQLTVDRTLDAGDVLVVTGTGAGRTRDTGPFTFAFNDLFTFRGDLIAQVDSYVVPCSHRSACADERKGPPDNRSAGPVSRSRQSTSADGMAAPGTSLGRNSFVSPG